MPRKTYFVLDSGKFFVLGDDPLPMNKDEKKRYEKALEVSKNNKEEKE